LVHTRPLGANFKENVFKAKGWSTAKGFRN